MLVINTLVLLQSVSLFVPTIFGYTVSHVAEESKVFSCFKKQIRAADIKTERLEAISLLRGHYVTKISMQEILSHFEGKMRTEWLMYDDGSPHEYYNYQIRSLWSESENNDYKYILMTSLLFDDRYRLCAILTEESWINHFQTGMVPGSGVKTIKSSCQVMSGVGRQIIYEEKDWGGNWDEGEM
ncbi:BgTH12-01875 [Blumeria graminis f. sp. triticale]|uniref:BgtE-20086 n=3 Tax=Blumeria graminis TaxID=34373 RepID=A0A381LGZ3_BLUGR|nr:BgTH12-01875 [Blumeria graminis f. sp. triticale]VDB84189.1 BgtE-20086 [Blumeria graminis f. sp. tritici]